MPEPEIRYTTTADGASIAAGKVIAAANSLKHGLRARATVFTMRCDLCHK